VEHANAVTEAFFGLGVAQNIDTHAPHFSYIHESREKVLVLKILASFIADIAFCCSRRLQIPVYWLLSSRNKTTAVRAMISESIKMLDLHKKREYKNEDMESTTKVTFGAFNQGEFPTIACFNKATIALGVDFDALIAAMQIFVDEHVAPVWGTPAKLIKSTDFVKGAWGNGLP
jgi:hypothetical protein